MNEQLSLLCAETSGVPMLLCPAELAGCWEGIKEPRNGRIIEADFILNTPDGPHVDYDRACDLAHEYVATISIGAGHALLLGDEIPALYWIPSESFTGGYMLTWLYLAEQEPNYQTLAASLPSDFFSATGCSVTCSDQGFLLFPSTHSPMDGEHFECIDIDLPDGRYSAAIGLYETSDTSLRIIKLQLQAS